MNAECDIIAVIGPTASGKTGFAVQQALKREGEILNADSQQFYRGLDIGTGKTDSIKSPVRHWLLDCCAPGEHMTAMDFAARADGIIARLHQAGKIPVVTGGTGLYLRALLEGLDPLPARDPEVRARLEKCLELEGAAVLHRRLRDIDPISAARIHPNDPARLIRYLEIYELSGQAPSQLQSGKRPGRLRYRTQFYYLRPDRERLRQMIVARVRGMLAAGWLEEVTRLLQQGIDFSSLPNKPIGYGELSWVVQGKMGLSEAEAKIVQKTWQYAKRQMTFFRGLLELPAYSTEGSAISLIEAPGESFA